MKITKSELKEMIREALREELNNRSITEGAMNGGQAEGGSLDTAKRPGGSTSQLKFDKLDGKKTKIVKAKDLKPGMVTDTGTVQKVTNVGWQNGKPSVEVSYGGVGTRGSYASDVVAADRDYEVLDESLEEELESIFEGIFDSKETKQKAYTKIITDAFKKAPAAIAAEVASKAVDAVEETNDCLDDDNSSTTTAAAKNFISAMTSAKAGAQKNPYGMLNSIIAYVQKYNRDSVNLEDLVEFKRAAIGVQNAEKDGKKAIDYLLELLNKQMSTRIDRTIAFIKKEYSI
jgi:hypothetical protein